MPKLAVVSKKLCDRCLPGNVESFFRKTIVQKPFLTAGFESGNFLEKYLMFLLKIGILFLRNFFFYFKLLYQEVFFFSKTQGYVITFACKKFVVQTPLSPLDLSSFSAGIYLLKVNGGNSRKGVKSVQS